MGQDSWVLCSIAFRLCVRETCLHHAESSTVRNYSWGCPNLRVQSRERARHERNCHRQQTRHRRDEETLRRRFQAPLAAARPDRCGGEDEGGKAAGRLALLNKIFKLRCEFDIARCPCLE